MSKTISKYKTILVKTNSKEYISFKVQSYDEETGRILGKRTDERTVGNPNPKGNEIIIAHKDDIISCLD